MPTMPETTPREAAGRHPPPDGHDADDSPATVVGPCTAGPTASATTSVVTTGAAPHKSNSGDDDGDDRCNAEVVTAAGTAEERFLSSQRRRVERNAVRATRRREETHLASAPSESVPAFWSQFSAARASIERGLEAMLPPPPGTDVDDDDEGGGDAAAGGVRCRYVTAAQRNRGRAELDALRDRAVSSLQEAAAGGAAVFLPAADARRAGEEAAATLRRIERARDVVCPREKFVFRRYRAAMEAREKENSTPTQDRRDEELASRGEAAPEDGAGRRSDGGGFGFEGRSGCSLSLTRKGDEGGGGACTGVLQSEKRDGLDMDRNCYLSNLEDCVVTLKETFGSIRMENLRNCTVYCGPISGSAYVDSCSECTIFVAARQLRVHDTRRVDFHVHVKSGPIIEDCAGVRFSGTYRSMMRYDGLGDQMVSSGLLDDDINEYRNVKDFKWHNLLEKSPNWSLMSDGDASRHVSKSEEIEIVRVVDGGDAGGDAGGQGRNGTSGGEGASTGCAIASPTSEHDDDGEEEDEL